MDSPENKNEDVTISELNENYVLKLTDDNESETEDNPSLICNKNKIQDFDTSMDQRRDSIEEFNQHSVLKDIDMSDSETTKSANILRMKALIDSDSDEEITSKWIDSDSDGDIIRKTLALTNSESDNKINNTSNFESLDKTTKKFSKKRKKTKVLVDSSDDDEEKEKSKELELKENYKVNIYKIN